jgi:mono/diheme cytochrome c family protein
MPPAKAEPGRDPQMSRRAAYLNVWFALTSIALLVTFSLMIWYDYDREWKKYQVAFNVLEVNQTNRQIKQVEGKVDAKRSQALQAQIAQGEKEIAARHDDVKKAEAEKGRLEGEWYRVDQDYRFTRAEIDVARYDYEEARRHQAGSTDRKRRALQELEKKAADLKLKLEDVIARREAAGSRLGELEKTKLEAEKQQKELFAERDRLQERLHKIQPGFASFVRNMPVLDMLNPSLKINQIMPASLTDDVIFTRTEKVDRCTTCHLAIDTKGYEKEKQPFRTHPDMELYLQGPHPIDRVGCTSCHQGRGRATSFLKAAHTASSPEQEKAWGRFSGEKAYHGLHYWDYPMMAKGHTEAQCVRCHQGAVEVPKAPSLNTGRWLVEKYGCYGCHKIKGWEDLRKVGPDLTKVLSKTNEEWIFRWIKEPKAFRPTRMPQIWDVRSPDHESTAMKARNDVEANSVVAYLTEKSSREAYPAPPAGDLAAGRKTLETVGCLGCHRIGQDSRGVPEIAAASFRTHGPNLDGTGSKVSAGWLYAWVKDPKGYWHETRMPNLRLSDKEAADITAYLMSLKEDAFMARARPAIDPALRDNLVREHLFAASVPTKEVEAKLAAMDDHQRTLFVGEKTIGRYGCFGCHTIAGFEKTSPIGVELTEEGSKLVERLDFGFEEGKIPHTLPGWVHRKLMEPRVFDAGKEKKPEELLRMPKFWFAEKEADAVVTAVMSFGKDPAPLAAQKQLSADERYVERGARLVRNYNCRGCHVLGETGGAIREVVKDRLERSGGDTLQTVALSPPLLYNAESKMGEGSRVQTDWLHGFLSDPSRQIRPWLELRMPTFQFTEDEINTVTRYFAALDRVPYPYDPKPTPDPTLLAAGHDLFTRWQCVKCHVVAGKLPDQEPAAMAPDLANVPSRLRADWLPFWLADPQRLQPGTRMPAAFPKNPQENAYPEVLGGDQQKQIAAVREYLLSLGGGAASRAPASAKPPAGRGTKAAERKEPTTSARAASRR